MDEEPGCAPFPLSRLPTPPLLSLPLRGEAEDPTDHRHILTAFKLRNADADASKITCMQAKRINIYSLVLIIIHSINILENISN
jgi:hypothetical protein